MMLWVGCDNGMYDCILYLQYYYQEVPLNERILCTASPHGSLVSISSSPGGRPTNYKKWREESLRKAHEAVMKGEFSVSRAAEEYGVPRSTLHDHVSGRVQVGSTSGPPRYLSALEEEEMAAFLRNCAEIGFAKSRQQVIALVQEVVNKKGIKVKVTHGLWHSFRSRHRDLMLRTLRSCRT